MTLGLTPSQTVGPYFHIGAKWLFREKIASKDAAGTHIELGGRVLDAQGQPVPDALIEIWQADHEGHYPTGVNPQAGATGFIGWGRTATDDQGRFRFFTIRPGLVPGIGGEYQAPHMTVTLFMRGLLRHLWTRVYFVDEASTSTDCVLSLVPSDRRHTLLAHPESPHSNRYVWNIVLQGKDETVFFDGDAH